jgi:hypothetical protein
MFQTRTTKLGSAKLGHSFDGVRSACFWTPVEGKVGTESESRRFGIHCHNGDATMVDVQPTENLAIDPPPLPVSDAPLAGNPILMRGSTGRRKNSSTAKLGSWQVALPIAAVVLLAGGAAAYFFAQQSQPQPLTTNPPAAASAPAGPVASTQAPTAAPVAPTEAAPPPAAAPVAAAPREHVTRMAREEPSRAAVRHAAVRHARAASDEAADVSATAPEAAPASAPSAPPVISPPPAQ